LRVGDDNQITTAARCSAALADSEILPAGIGVPAPGAPGIWGQSDRENPAVFLGVDQVAQLAAEVERQGGGVAGFHDLGLWMPAQEPGRKHHTGEFGFGGARRQIDNHPLQLAPLDALKHFGHDVMVPALDEPGPDLAHKGQKAPTRLCRIGFTSAHEEVQMPGDLCTLFGGEALIVEEPRVVLELAAFAGSGGTHDIRVTPYSVPVDLAIGLALATELENPLLVPCVSHFPAARADLRRIDVASRCAGVPRRCLAGDPQCASHQIWRVERSVRDGSWLKPGPLNQTQLSFLVDFW
jgi:hypothetical protein